MSNRPSPPDVDPITTLGSPILRNRAASLGADEIRSARIQSLIDRMRRAMQEYEGVGLAAPQIGVPLRLVVVEDTPAFVEAWSPEMRELLQRQPVPFQVLVNPVVRILDETPVWAYEACLSVCASGIWAQAPRAQRVAVAALDERGDSISFEATGWHARIIQHEVDHLDGVLFIDRMDPRTATDKDGWLQRWRLCPPSQARRELGVDE